MDDLIKRTVEVRRYVDDATTVGDKLCRSEEALRVHAAALADAQATIARLKALLREAWETLEDGWGTEQVTKEATEAYFELMPRLKAELSPREGEGT